MMNGGNFGQYFAEMTSGGHLEFGKYLFVIKKHKNKSSLLLFAENWTFWLKNVESSREPFGASDMP